MLVTILNTSSTQQPISTHCVTLEVGGSVTVTRTASDLDMDLQLKQLVLDGLVSLTFVKEALDVVQTGVEGKVREYNNTTRPAATLFTVGYMIWNTSDSAMNFSTGSVWVDSTGTLT